MSKVSISVVIPFYKGNQYLKRLFNSIEKVAIENESSANFEVILVNDSPNVEVVLPNIYKKIAVHIYTNEQNLGIQETRINGLKYAKGDWILFIDQDDEIIPTGFMTQISLTESSDVVVGNGNYMMGSVNTAIYFNKSSMEYIIQKNRFIEIRNLIPSPGECLIRKNIIPDLWKNNIMKINGADDWFLWILLFLNGAKFSCNEQYVYIHNDSNGQNLSADLDKMHESGLEMLGILDREGVLNKNEYKKLKHSIEFKYLKDTKKLTILKILKYRNTVAKNIIYKLRLKLCSKSLID